MGVIRQVEMTPGSREPVSWHAVTRYLNRCRVVSDGNVSPAVRQHAHENQQVGLAIILPEISLVYLTYLSNSPEVHMTSLKRTARIAGLWYLGFSLGPFYLLYVPSQTVVRNDAAATAARVLGHEKLFRWGMLAETLGAVIFIGLSLALYRLFEDVDRHRATTGSSGAGFICSRPDSRGFQCGCAPRLSRRRCLRRLRWPHTRGDRHVLDQDAWAGKWHQPDVLGIMAVAFWMLGRALAFLAALARVLAPA